MSKKILIVSEVFHPESGLINDFATELVKKGFGVEVLTQHPSYPQGKVFDGYKNSDYALDNWNGIKIHRFKVVEGYKESIIKKILNYRKFVLDGSKIGRKIGGRFDHILVYQTGPLTLALPAIAIKKKFGTPVTTWTFDIWPDAIYAYGFPEIFPITTFVNSIIRKVYENSDNIFVSSKAFTDTIQKYSGDKKIDYAPNWLIVQEHKPSQLKLDPVKFNFTFTGNISMAQNLENVIKGWAKSGIENKAVLNIVGDGSNLLSLKSLVAKENIKGVIFHGRFPSDQMYSILTQSDMLVLPLIADVGIMKTEPYKLQSYLEAGKPIYGIIDGAGRVIIEEYKLGICANPTDIQHIAQVFNSAMDFATNHLDSSIANSAQELLDTRFNRKNIIQKMIQVITK